MTEDRFVSNLTASILAVGVNPPADGPMAAFVYADSAERGLELLKLLRFDLLLATSYAVGGRVGEFARRLQAIAPHQKWVLAGHDVTEVDEIAARCGGAAAVLDDAHDFETAVTLAQRFAARRPRARAVPQVVRT